MDTNFPVLLGRACLCRNHHDRTDGMIEDDAFCQLAVDALVRRGWQLPLDGCVCSDYFLRCYDRLYQLVRDASDVIDDCLIQEYDQWKHLHWSDAHN